MNYKMIVLSKNDELGIDKSFENYSTIMSLMRGEAHELDDELFKIMTGRDDRYANVAAEAMDVIQVAINLLYKLKDDGHIDLNEVMEKHIEKLSVRGWQFNRFLDISEKAVEI